jgi:hypothetical protein
MSLTSKEWFLILMHCLFSPGSMWIIQIYLRYWLITILLATCLQHVCVLVNMPKFFWSCFTPLISLACIFSFRCKRKSLMDYIIIIVGWWSADHAYNVSWLVWPFFIFRMYVTAFSTCLILANQVLHPMHSVDGADCC